MTPRSLLLAAAGAALVVLTLVVQFSHLTDRPVGYYLDESSFSYNAWTMAQSGVDEYGRPWPIFFEAFDDWKTAPYIDLLAIVFRVVGPSILAARALSALAGVLTVVLLATLAYRVTRRAEIALIVGASALLQPWLFEPTKLAMEVAIMPALLAGYLLALHTWPPTGSRRSAVVLGLILALITYTYTLGRLLGPLLALGLVLYASRARWKGVLVTWLVYGITLIPLAVFNLTNPGALTVRLAESNYLNLPLPDLIATFVHQFLANMDPVRILLTGDDNPRHHAPGIMGSLLAGTLVLALIGLDRIVRRFRSDPWSRYLAYGLVVAFIPASLTLAPFHVHRLIAVPIFLVAMAIPALGWLIGEHGPAVRWRQAAAVTLAIAVLAQGAWFQVRYDQVAPGRGAWFDDAYPGLLDRALATGADPIYLADGIVPGYIHAYWYGATMGVPASRFVHLPRDTRAPSGAIVLSSEQDCSPCEVLAAGGFFKLYRVP